MKMQKYLPVQQKLIIGLVLMISLIALPNLLRAQDKIVKRDSTIIEAKVVEVTLSEVKFWEFKNQNGPLLTIPLTEILAIIYQNGEKKEFKLGKLTQYLEISKTVRIDSLKCIENLLGVKLENSTGIRVGVKITKVLENSIFKDHIERVENTVMNAIGSGTAVKIKKTSDLVREIYKLYNQGKTLIDIGVYGIGRLSNLTPGRNWIDIGDLAKCMAESGVEQAKMSVAESRQAGAYVAKLYFKKRHNMSFTGGLLGGVLGGIPGTVAMSAFTALPVDSYMVPKVPDNVDQEAWKRGYIAKIKSMKLGRTIVGGALGTLYIVVFVPLYCAL